MSCQKGVLFGPHTVGELKDLTNRSFMEYNYPNCEQCQRGRSESSPIKMNTFFHRSLALSVPIYGNFQSNGTNRQEQGMIIVALCFDFRQI